MFCLNVDGECAGSSDEGPGCGLREIKTTFKNWNEPGASHGLVGPRMIYIIGDVDLVGDDTEPQVAVRLRALEARIRASAAVADAVLSLSAPDEPSLLP